MRIFLVLTLAAACGQKPAPTATPSPTPTPAPTASEPAVPPAAPTAPVATASPEETFKTKLIAALDANDPALWSALLTKDVRDKLGADGIAKSLKAWRDAAPTAELKAATIQTKDTKVVFEGVKTKLRGPYAIHVKLEDGELHIDER